MTIAVCRIKCGAMIRLTSLGALVRKSAHLFMWCTEMRGRGVSPVGTKRAWSLGAHGAADSRAVGPQPSSGHVRAQRAGPRAPSALCESPGTGGGPRGLPGAVPWSRVPRGKERAKEVPGREEDDFREDPETGKGSIFRRKWGALCVPGRVSQTECPAVRGQGPPWAGLEHRAVFMQTVLPASQRPPFVTKTRMCSRDPG